MYAQTCIIWRQICHFFLYCRYIDKNSKQQCREIPKLNSTSTTADTRDHDEYCMVVLKYFFPQLMLIWPKSILIPHSVTSVSNKDEQQRVTDTTSSHYHSFCNGSGDSCCLMAAQLVMRSYIPSRLITCCSLIRNNLLCDNCVIYLNHTAFGAPHIHRMQFKVKQLQVDGSVLGCSTMIQTALGTRRVLCHKTGRQPAMLGRVGLQRVLKVAVWTERQATYWSLFLCGSWSNFLFQIASAPVSMIHDVSW